LAEYQVSQIYEGLKESDLYILMEFFKMLGNPARIRILLLLMLTNRKEKALSRACNFFRSGALHS